VKGLLLPVCVWRTNSMMATQLQHQQAQAVLPRLDHFTLEDADCVYEPAEDTYLLCDAILKDKELLVARNPLIIAEIGCVFDSCIGLLIF
jgi:methylase of polypeptide subunit release factors